MECGAVVVLGSASIDGRTHFGQIYTVPFNERYTLCRARGRTYAPGEKFLTRYLELPQARQTCTVLGCRPKECWGYLHGINEHQVAVGCLPLPPAISCDHPGLLGTDLVRLCLEQSQRARQAVDLLIHCIETFGQGSFRGCHPEENRDSTFLVADPAEAYVIEAAGKYWALQEIQQARAVCPARVIRQDWDRICHGLAGLAIERGWWPQDGSKLDFAGVLAQKGLADESALSRWGRTTVLLEEQNGHVDLPFIRRILTDYGSHYGLDFNPAPSAREVRRAAGMVTSLGPDRAIPPVAWCALGAPEASVFFPVFLNGELPGPLANPEAPSARWRLDETAGIHKPHRDREAAREGLARLQARIDRETEEFLVECATIRQKGFVADLDRQTSLFMEHNLEQFEEVMRQFFAGPGISRQSALSV